VSSMSLPYGGMERNNLNDGSCCGVIAAKRAVSGRNCITNNWPRGQTKLGEDLNGRRGLRLTEDGRRPKRDHAVIFAAFCYRRSAGDLFDTFNLTRVTRSHFGPFQINRRNDP
jgi:hypothetical protein